MKGIEGNRWVCHTCGADDVTHLIPSEDEFTWQAACEECQLKFIAAVKAHKEKQAKESTSGE